MFIASYIHMGILGGAIYLDGEKAAFRTNKLTVGPEIRNMQMPYADIASVESGKTPLFPTVTIRMRNGDTRKFLVFGRKRLLSRLKEKGVA